MFRIILAVIGIWLLYKFIFELIIPVYRSTKIMRSKFREMQDQMNQHQQTNADNFSNNSQYRKVTPDDQKGDYIEFEDVK